MKPAAALTEICKHADRIAPRLGPTLAKLDEYSGVGYPTGGGSGRSSETSNPTARIATALVDQERAWNGKDPFVRDSYDRDKAQLAEELNTAEACMRRARDIIDRNQALPSDVLRAANGCEPCSRVLTGGRPHESSWQAVYSRIERPENPEGPKLALCSFHYEFWERYEELPTPTINEYHLEHLGSRIPRQLIRDQMPQAWTRAQSKAAGRPLGITRLEQSA